MANKKICSKCNREKSETEFFVNVRAGGERIDLCKTCLTQYIDNRDPETFLWILEKFDVPYIEQVWINTANSVYIKDPKSFGPSSVIGRYIRMMNATQYIQYHYRDSDHLNAEEKKRHEDFQRRVREKQKHDEKKLEQGEISQAQYNTLYAPQNWGIDGMNAPLYPTQTEQEIMQIEEEDEVLRQLPNNGNRSSIYNFSLNEAEVASQLTDEDIQYLMVKWGSHYRPSEWVAMENMYSRYAAEFDLTIDREETLKKICRTSLKMDEALDLGDVNAYKAYSAVLKDLRQSGKFTEAQATEEKKEEIRYLDTIGELVRLCEQQKGIIPQLPEEDYAQDTIDLTIKDLQGYTYNLVSNELGLGDLIESYIAKLERAEDNDPLTEEIITSSLEAESAQLTDSEAMAFQDWLDNGIEQDAEELLKTLEEDIWG